MEFRPSEQAGKSQLQYGVPVRHGVFVIGPELSQPGLIAEINLLLFFRGEKFRHSLLNLRSHPACQKRFGGTGGDAGEAVAYGEFDLNFVEHLGECMGFCQRAGQGRS